MALALFGVGWMFQFAGHAVEGKRPEFFHDWRFLFVGEVSRRLRSDYADEARVLRR